MCDATHSYVIFSSTCSKRRKCTIATHSLYVTHSRDSFICNVTHPRVKGLMYKRLMRLNYDSVTLWPNDLDKDISRSHRAESHSHRWLMYVSIDLWLIHVWNDFCMSLLTCDSSTCEMTSVCLYWLMTHPRVKWLLYVSFDWWLIHVWNAACIAAHPAKQEHLALRDMISVVTTQSCMPWLMHKVAAYPSVTWLNVWRDSSHISRLLRRLVGSLKI